MASSKWEERYVGLLKKVDDLVEEAARANPDAADDLNSLWKDADSILMDLQQVMIDIDEGNYDEGEGEGDGDGDGA